MLHYTGMKVSLISFFVLYAIVFSAAPVQAAPRVGHAFGANIHLQQRVPADEQATVLDAAQSAGMQWAREEFRWEVIEPSDGVFDFTQYDAIVDSYAERNMNVLGLLTYSTQDASTKPSDNDYEFYPPDITEWKKYVRTVVRQYEGQVHHWEIWNEPNHEGFWKGTQKEYIAVLQAAANVIHDENPNAKVVLGGLSGADSDYLNGILNGIDSGVVDIVAIHPYRQIDGSFTYAPEDAQDRLNTLRSDIYNVLAVMRRHGYKKTPIWLTEMGWPTSTAGVSKTRQAQFLMRAYVEALSIPQVKKIFWYSLVDDDEQFGLLTDEYAEKRAFQSHQFIKRHIRKAKLQHTTFPNAKDFPVFTYEWHYAHTECATTRRFLKTAEDIQLTYEFEQDPSCYAPVITDAILPEHTRALQFMGKGSNADVTLRIRIRDESGEVFQYTLSMMPDQWLPYTVQLNEPAPSWNGDRNGKLDGQLKFEAVVIDNNGDTTGAGTFHIKDMKTTTDAHTYMTRFTKKGSPWAVVWRNTNSKKMPIHFGKQTRIRVKRFQKKNSVEVSSNGYYQIRLNHFTHMLKGLGQ